MMDKNTTPRTSPSVSSSPPIPPASIPTSTTQQSTKELKVPKCTQCRKCCKFSHPTQLCKEEFPTCPICSGRRTRDAHRCGNDPKLLKDPNPSKDTKQPKPTAAAAGTDGKLSAKELKEKKKAEKAARRADSKAASGAPPPSQTGPKGPQKGDKNVLPAAQPSPPGGIVKTIYPTSPVPVVKEVEVVVEKAKDNGLVGLLKDLAVEQQDKKKATVFGIANAHPDVHPAILTLGMQINQYVLAGSTARCLGFLLAIKRVIHDYETPAHSTLSRHLPGHYLSHQIAYLLSARPMSTAMGNTIRWLKQEIANISPDLTQEAAKNLLCDKIDVFIREKISVADDMIVNTTVARYIKNNDVILTYGKSQVVERALLEAHRRGRRFRVVVVDSRPLLEGANVLQGLSQAGISCEYVHLYALEYSIREVTAVLLGAHAVMADGALYSRAGTAAVAVCAKEAGIPVVVACESIKFSDKINLDGIVFNELGDPELLVTMSGSNRKELGPLKGWRDVENTHVDSFRYDVTPSEYVKMIICEHGCVAPSSVGSVLRTAAGAV